MFNILVVEDDKNTGKLMETVLSANGFHPILASDGIEALKILDIQHVDLIILDIMMPRMDGYELTQQLRNSNYTLPILMVTAKQLPVDKKKGFIVGTDDYMTKPIDDEEMILRIKALLRRAKIVNEHKIIIGEVTLDYDSLSVSRKDKRHTLPQKEFYLLYKLLSYPNKIFTRIQLMDEIWGIDSDSTDYTVNVHINRLRKRFEDYPEFEIQTIRGLGYKAVKKI
ncbi:response regulator transcription factor [Sinanaerobacter sp. ZZT-01]|uniref:response regulator transcription factor n=1 Tax=Sinanaerobacter sp. ZZT-01 TaxID=3111540 RepID=UPI002D78253D|nr:response regulator transcription factor [Sinanaerobacter sp. ZZT-01]WRR93509.1 response regulator transcription factor [Sinanaerobacter sp. ZZT-01]